MDLSNIKAGDVFKNYKQLCEALGEKTKTGNSKIAQLKEWKRYFNFTKQGYKFIINEIYETTKLKIDLRSNGNNKKYGSIAITHPHLIKHLHPFKNNKYDINNISQYSIKQLWWICSKCGKEFKKSVNKVAGRDKVNCQECSMSIGEREIYKFLKKYRIKFEREYTFDDLKGMGNRLLRFDFAVLDNNNDVICLIEYDGEYHDKLLNPSNENYLLITTHDELKNTYCKDNNIPLIRIHFEHKKEIRSLLAKSLLNVDIDKNIKQAIGTVKNFVLCKIDRVSLKWIWNG
ncbi:zinc-ribbon domain-containing protein [Bacillus smithii]|uniref:zinc-ribbon domain-containing protein n=1 Tax=Bacillus smithii TaxID=1479 RepID=UPI002E1BCFAC|nr:zinc-ribbon domain-containing protein [Bacillus smithii]MED4928985.1 zinc-ribbon domain-containing protein [Bacillus smithii]